MARPMHEQRDRADSFGDLAETYDRTRPTYPSELIDRIVAATPDRRAVLDVGCGTGKLGRLFAARGCDVLGVEPDARMAAVARSHGLDVEVSPFESWDDGGRRFDAVVAGQAWHWVDPVTGSRRAAEVLRPGGRIALLWNVSRHEDGMHAALEAPYAEHFPENDGTGVQGTDVDGIVAAFRFDGEPRLGEPEVWSHSWSQTHPRDEWLDQVATQSAHHALAEDRRARLFEAVGAVIDRVGGGTITILYETVAITAVRS